MGGSELAVHAVKRVGHGVGDFSTLQIALESKNIVAKNDDVVVLLFGNAPNQEMDFAGVLRKISCDLLADESVRQVANFETTLDRVVIGQGYEIHAALE